MAWRRPPPRGNWGEPARARAVVAAAPPLGAVLPWTADRRGLPLPGVPLDALRHLGTLGRLDDPKSRSSAAAAAAEAERRQRQPNLGQTPDANNNFCSSGLL